MLRYSWNLIFLSLFSAGIILLGGCGAGGGGPQGDNGLESESFSLSLARNISGSSLNSDKPVVAADSNGNVHIAWEETSPKYYTEIFLAKSADFGDTFTTARNLTTASSSDCSEFGGFSWDASITAGRDGNAYLAWLNAGIDGSLNPRVKFFDEKKSSCKILSETASYAVSPLIRRDGANGIHITWAGKSDITGMKEIYYRVSRDEGATFTPSVYETPRNISNTLTDSSDPLLGFEGSLLQGSENILTVNIVWVEGPSGSGDVAYSRSADGGNSFFYYYEPLSEIGFQATCPRIISHGREKVFVVYKSNKGDGSRIYLTRKLSNYSSFSYPIKISTISTSNPEMSCPQAGIDSHGVIYVAWSAGDKVWIAVSDDNGVSFAIHSGSSSSAGVISSFKLLIDDIYAFLVWVEEVDGKANVNIKGSKNHGKSFTPAISISNATEYLPVNPALASDGNGNFYVAWAEGIDKKRDVHFVRGQWSKEISP